MIKELAINVINNVKNVMKINVDNAKMDSTETLKILLNALLVKKIANFVQIQSAQLAKQDSFLMLI